MMKNKESSAIDFIKKTLGFSLGSYIGAVITFVASYVNTRLYDTATMGKINLFFSVQTFMLYFAYFGMDQSYCRYYYDCQTEGERKNLFDECLSISLYTSLVEIVIIVFIWKVISNYIAGTESLVVITALLVSVFAQVLWRYLSLYQRMNQQILLYTILMILNSVTNKLSYTAMAWYSRNYIVCITAIAVSSLIVTVVFYCLQSEKGKIYGIHAIKKSKNIKQILRFGVPLMPVSLISWLNSSIPIIFLRYLTTYETVGIYSNTIVLSSVIGLVQSGFSTFWVPFYYKNYKTGNSGIKKIHNTMCNIMVVFAILLIAFKELLYNILGTSYRSGMSVFSLIVVSPICYAIGETTGIGITISEKSYLNSIIYFTGSLCNALFSFLLIPFWGIEGAGISVALSAVITLAIKTIVGEKYYCVIESYKKTGGALIILLSAVICDCFEEHIGMTLKNVIMVMLLIIMALIYRKEIRYCINLCKTMISRRNKTS